MKDTPCLNLSLEKKKKKKHHAKPQIGLEEGVKVEAVARMGLY